MHFKQLDWRAGNVRSLQNLTRSLHEEGNSKGQQTRIKGPRKHSRMQFAVTDNNPSAVKMLYKTLAVTPRFERSRKLLE